MALLNRNRTAERARWRTVDLLTAAMVGVVFGVAYWGWDSIYGGLGALVSALGPAQGLLGGPWLIAGVVAGLLVRRPGAALFAELLAATVEAVFPGNPWAWTTLISGGLQGIGVEVALGLLFYRRFGWPVAALGGALAAAGEMVYEWSAYWQGYSLVWKLAYLGSFMLSGAVVAGIGGWLLTRALAATGAVDALPAGREAARRHAV
ncbi:MAG TPA: ECF transporter S component [Nocardioidaceae bacterium]|nr:ECF transporter S component [Nocardioidaceae bacterium]